MALSMKKIILQYLKVKIANDDLVIRNSEMEKVKNFASKHYGKFHSVGTFERRFREIKNNPAMLSQIGVVRLDDVSDQFGSREKVLKMVVDRDLFSA